MIAQIRSELLKIRSTRTTIGLLLGMIALILLFTLLTGLLTHPSGLGSKEDQRQLLSLGSLAGVFSALAGVLLVTSEYRYGTIPPTFLFNPARSHVLTAKIVVGALAGLAFGILGEAIGWAIGYVILDGRGITIVLTSSDVLLLTLGGLAGVALWGAIGVGVGAIIHNQVGAVITLLAWGLVVNNLLFGLVPFVGRFVPTRAADALAIAFARVTSRARRVDCHARDRQSGTCFRVGTSLSAHGPAVVLCAASAHEPRTELAGSQQAVAGLGAVTGAGGPCQRARSWPPGTWPLHRRLGCRSAASASQFDGPKEKQDHGVARDSGVRAWVIAEVAESGSLSVRLFAASKH
jgi:ABC-2 type transport system permease protein